MKLNIKHIATLANLPLKDEEIKQLESQLGETLDYINALNEINTDNTQPATHLTSLENVMRGDIPTDSLTQEQALSNTSETHNGLFKVKGILTND